MLVSRLSILSSVALAAGLSYWIDPRLLWGALILYAANVLVSFWLEAETEGAYWQTARASTVRAGAYGMTGLMVVVFNWMLRGVPGLLKVVFGFIAAVELLVAMGKLAQITPRLRPLWAWAVHKVDAVSPVTITTDQIDSLANGQGPHESDR